MSYHRPMLLNMNGRTDLDLPALRVMRTAMDCGDGGTPEQRNLLHLLAERIWRLPDFDIDSLEPISPMEVAQLFDDEVACRRVRHLLVLFEVLRHPPTVEQVALIDGFALALGGDEEGFQLIRGLVRNDTERAVEHLRATWNVSMNGVSERSIEARYDSLEEKIDDPDLAAQLRGLRDLPRGTLGREYIEFYLANHFDIPGEGVMHPGFFVQHDMSHLVAGLGPSAPGELALSAFQIGMFENEPHWMQFLVGLAAYELGVLGDDDFEAKAGVLEREGAIEFVVESFERGMHCTENYNDLSLLELADRPIAELRERFGVRPPREPFPEFIDVAV